MEQYHNFRLEITRHRIIHADAEGFFRSFRYMWSSFPLVLGLTACSYDAHPMAILTSAFAYLGSYYSEANPSLQGITMLLSISSWN